MGWGGRVAQGNGVRGDESNLWDGLCNRDLPAPRGRGWSSVAWEDEEEGDLDPWRLRAEGTHVLEREKSRHVCPRLSDSLWGAAGPEPAYNRGLATFTPHFCGLQRVLMKEPSFIYMFVHLSMKKCCCSISKQSMVQSASCCFHPRL